MRILKKVRGFVAILAFLPLFFQAELWSVDPVIISTPGENATSPQIAVDPNGNAVAVWIESDMIKSTSATLGGGWSSTINTLSGSVASHPQVQIDLNGTATALWVENGAIHASSLPLNGSWSIPVALSGLGASSPALAVDSTGNLIAVWEEGGMIDAATMPVGGSWPVTPDTISAMGASSPQIAIGGNGTAIAVWQGVVGMTPTVYAALTSVVGTWSAPAAISAANVNSCYPQIAMDASGNANAIWFTYSLAGLAYSDVVVNASFLPSGGSWSTPVNIGINQGIRNPADLVSKVVAGPGGAALAVWSTSYNGAVFTIQYNILSNGSWGIPALLTLNNLLSLDLDVAVDPNGTASVVWMYYDSASSSLFIQKALSDIGGYTPVISNIQTLSAGGNNASPTAAMNLSSTTTYSVTAWENYNGANNVIQALNGAYAVIQPPSNLAVTQQANDFGVLTELYNVLSWEASPSSNVTNYLIFRNGQYLYAVGGSTLQYIDVNRPVSETVTYGVAASNALFCQSQTEYVTFSN